MYEVGNKTNKEAESSHPAESGWSNRSMTQPFQGCNMGSIPVPDIMYHWSNGYDI